MKFRNSRMRPYLQLGDRLSQVWLNRYTLMMVLVLVKLVMFRINFKASLETSRKSIVDSCNSLDAALGQALSMPHYMAKGVNFMVAKSLQEVSDTSVKTMHLLVTVLEESLLFLINLWLGTYTCLLVALLDGTVDVAVKTSENVLDVVNTTVKATANELEDGLNGLSKVVNSVINVANKVKDFFNGKEEDISSGFNKVNLTIAGLREIKIPSSVDEKLASLQQKVPDFKEVQNKTASLVHEPFQMLKEKLRSSSFNMSVETMYVPDIEESRLCSSNTPAINQFYLDVAKGFDFCFKIIIALLIAFAILVMVPLAWEEYKSWSKLSNLKSEIEHYSNQKEEDPIDLYNKSFCRIHYTIGNFLSKCFKKDTHRRAARWFFSYITSARALTILGLALTGFLIVALQYLILKQVKMSIARANVELQTIKNDYQSSLSNSSNQWTENTNKYITDTESDMNKNLFDWATTTSTTVNNTINEVLNGIDTVLADVFNGTILYNPIKNVVGCMIGNKLKTIEKGLTWVNDRAHITLPRVNGTEITQAMMTTNATSEECKSCPLVNKIESDISKSLHAAITLYNKSIRLELITSAGIFALWVSQCLIGLIKVIYLLWTETIDPSHLILEFYPAIIPPASYE